MKTKNNSKEVAIAAAVTAIIAAAEAAVEAAVAYDAGPNAYATYIASIAAMKTPKE